MSLAPAPVAAAAPAGGAAGDTEDAGPIQLTTAFFGLTGPLGALPSFYTEQVVRAERGRDRALADFLDVINQRFTRLFLQAGEKYRLAAQLQRHGSAGADRMSAVLLALAGFGTPGLRGRLQVAESVILRNAGLFALRSRSAAALEAVLGGFLGMTVRVEQFTPRWMPVPEAEQTRLGAPGRYNRLDAEAFPGSQVRDAQGSFRIVVGPMGYGALLDLLPGGGRLRALTDLARVFAGPDLDFDVQLVLARDDVPDMQMTVEGAQAPRLGHNSWVPSFPSLMDRDDVIINPDWAEITA